jgi:BirA family biotin operon repressor/biotin-[acetyl-CoA-carboxylase] ligase
VLGQLERWYLDWRGEAGDADRCGLRAEYLGLCATVGQQVRVSLPGGSVVTGEASDVDSAGRLVVRSGAGPVPVSAGDVVHVR